MGRQIDEVDGGLWIDIARRFGPGWPGEFGDPEEEFLLAFGFCECDADFFRRRRQRFFRGAPVPPPKALGCEDRRLAPLLIEKQLAGVGGRAQPPHEVGDAPGPHHLDRPARIEILEDGSGELCPDGGGLSWEEDGLQGAQAVPERVGAGCGLTGRGAGAGALEGVEAVGLNAEEGGHGCL